MAIYMKYTAKSQGVIAGAITSGNFTGQIEVFSIDLGMGHSSGVSSALTTGKQVARPLVLTKRVDKATPLLLNSCINNEVATAVLITYVFEGAAAVKAVATIALTNALLQDFHHTAQSDGSTVETLTLNYQKCEFTWIDGGLTSMWDLTA